MRGTYVVAATGGVLMQDSTIPQTSAAIQRILRDAHTTFGLRVHEADCSLAHWLHRHRSWHRNSRTWAMTFWDWATHRARRQELCGRHVQLCRLRPAALFVATPSSTAAPAGRASGSRSTTPSAPRSTRASSWPAPRSTAAAAAAISAMSSTTARSRPAMRHCINGVALKFVPQGVELSCRHQPRGARHVVASDCVPLSGRWRCCRTRRPRASDSAPAGRGQRSRPSPAAASGAWSRRSTKLDGVVSAVSGYMGGTTQNPTYEQVSRGGTGHAEVVQVTYDPAKISYEKLLDVFWLNIDPVDKGGQFCDRGDQYRPEIFVHTRRAAQSRRGQQGSARCEQEAALAGRGARSPPPAPSPRPRSITRNSTSRTRAITSATAPAAGATRGSRRYGARPRPSELSVRLPRAQSVSPKPLSP